MYFKHYRQLYVSAALLSVIGCTEENKSCCTTANYGKRSQNLQLLLHKISFLKRFTAQRLYKMLQNISCDQFE
jgi:hypothetical protein